MIKKLFKILFIFLILPNFLFANNQFFQEGVNLYKNKQFNEAKFKFEQDIVFNLKVKCLFVFIKNI